MYRPVKKLKIIAAAFLVLSILLLGGFGCGETETETDTPPVSPSPTEVPDADRDGVNDVEDNCPSIKNSNQLDTDDDEIGDACDDCDDPDHDSVCIEEDNCLDLANADQGDVDGDGVGDACDVCSHDELNDLDGDSICADEDNCPNVENPDQADADADGMGDFCDVCHNDADNDIDGDDLCDDGSDPCPVDDANDADGDGLCEVDDNCPNTPNADQSDSNGNGVGDACEGDKDGDGILDDGDESGVVGDNYCTGGAIVNCDDNCIDVQNLDQVDTNGNGIGDACEVVCEGVSWQYQITYVSDDPQRPEENTIILTANVTGSEDIDGVSTYLIETEVDEVPLRYYYHADMGLIVPTDLRAPTVYRDETHKALVNETFPLYANVMGGIDVAVDRQYVDYEGISDTLAVGDAWTFRTFIDLPTFAVYIENNWAAEVVGEEEVTVPMGAYNCYKVEMTNDNGCINYEWWAVDEDFCTPIKYTNNCIYVGPEFGELVSYTIS